MAAQLILGLTLLVFVHEFGHFITAKMFGMRAEKFYIFFDAWGKKLWSKQIGETEYGIGWLPLGGYVKISGMIDESMDKEAMKLPPQPYEFRAKPAWQRFIVMIGGVVMNVITGIIIFSVYLHHYDKSYISMDAINKDGIYAYELAKEVGLETGDKIIAINGSSVERFKELASTKVLLGGTLTVQRQDGSTHEITMPNDLFKKIMQQPFISTQKETVSIAEIMPNSNASKAGLQKQDIIKDVNGIMINRFEEFKENLQKTKGQTALIGVERNGELQIIPTEVDTTGKIGIAPNIALPYPTTPYSWASAFNFGTKDSYEMLVTQALSFKLLFSGKVPVTDSLSGPIGIAKIYGAEFDWAKFWRITGLLSLVLAFMNILPIPALDGGHVLIIIIETIIRRPLSDKLKENMQMVGMFILLGLMLFAFGNDIYKLF